MTRRIAPCTRRVAIRLTVIGTALAAMAGMTATTAMAGPEPAPPPSPLMLITPRSATAYEYHGRAYVYVPVQLQAVGSAFEIWAHRGAKYAMPIRAKYRDANGVGLLPRGTMKNFRGLTKFFDITIQDSAGHTVIHRMTTACLNGDTQRVVPSGAAHSPYPWDCPDNPFTLGSVQGIAEGWATSVPLFRFGSVKLQRGTYTMHVQIAQAFRTSLGIRDRDSQGTVTLHIRSGKRLPAEPGEGDGSPVAVPAPQRIGTPLDAPPSNGPEPDLAPLPAWHIGISKDSKFLQFNATVWNAGTSPLVVEGFREKHKPVMDAYQYFYDSDGNQVGYVPAGHMVWDPRRTHHHWHFEDFARYELLRADKATVQRSHKEAFCLANTDAIDYTVPGADWTPDDTDLQTSCGGFAARSVSEVLASGSGDTYQQFRGGQAFSLANVPNGTYYISIQANPKHILTELSTDNNIALRKIRLGGTPEHRTVHVFPVGTVHA